MADRAYDVIIVGARVAGAATALLLARAGLSVLAVDQVRFPSDTLSSHQIQVPGVARLRRWGVLDAVVASGAPPTRKVRFDVGPTVLEGCFPEYDGVDALYSPRRTVLDKILVDAARAAGAEIRENYHVAELVWSEGRVTGIRGGTRGGATAVDTASIVIGADGKHSTVAEAVGAKQYRKRPQLAAATYSYWEGVPLTSGELYQRPGRAVAVFPTNDDFTMIYTAMPLTEFDGLHQDIEGAYLRTLDSCGDLGERVRTGRRVERLRSAPAQPNTYRMPHGPGWALVGDAGLVMDSISAQGISNALRDAELLSSAVTAGLAGTRPLDGAMADYRRARDTAVRAMYDFTVGLASFVATTNSTQEREFFGAIARDQAEIDRFLGVFAGAIPMKGYFGIRNGYRLIGARGMARIVRDEIRFITRSRG